MKFVMIFQKLISTAKTYMAIKNKNNFFALHSNFILITLTCLLIFSSLPRELNALDTDLGGNLFENHCAGCHKDFPLNLYQVHLAL